MYSSISNMSEIRVKRLNNIDKLRCICAFLVVYVHAPISGEIGLYLSSLARVAVPIFFIISGYFYTLSSSGRQIKKLIILLVLGNAIYLIWYTLRSAHAGHAVKYLKTVFKLKRVRGFLLLNNNYISGHLWYLGAILYVTVIITLIFRINELIGRRILYILIPFLLAGDLLLGKYSLLVTGMEYQVSIVRNWIFVGIPYFSIGLLIKEYEGYIYNRICGNGKIFLLGVILLSSAGIIVEKSMLMNIGLDTKREHYISTTFLAISVFLLFLFFVSNNHNKISEIGKYYSTWVYILHLIFKKILDELANVTGLENVYIYVCPFVVFIITTLFVEILFRIIKSDTYRVIKNKISST